MFERLEVSTRHHALPTCRDESEDNLHKLVFQELGIRRLGKIWQHTIDLSQPRYHVPNSQVLWFSKIALKIVLLGPCGKLMICKVVACEFVHTRA
eukprot:4278119-Ditylum_brightwellii.AAC.1